MNSGDEIKISEEVKARKKISENDTSELTTRLKHMILSVDGKSEKKHINDFVENEFLSLDSLAYRKYLATITPDVDMNVTVKDLTGREQVITVPITVRFFWPDTGV